MERLSHTGRHLEDLHLRQRTYELLSMVREAKPEEKKALRKKGFTFFDIKAMSLNQLIQKHPSHFLRVNESRELREYVPPAMTIALNLEQLTVPNSKFQPRDVQLEMIEGQSKLLEKEFPDAKMVMLPASAYAQVDIARKIFKGPPFACALDSKGFGDLAYFALVGRYHPDLPLEVGYWGNYDGVAVPAVMFSVNKGFY